MLKSLSKFPELKILAYLGIITLAYHLFTIFGTFVSFFSDIFLLILLSWIVAFLGEPLVVFLTKYNLPRNAAAALVYLLLAVITVLFFVLVTPQIISQFSQLATIIPSYIPTNSIWSARVEGFFSSTFSNSVSLISQIASAVTNLILIFILSFYFLISKHQISKFILQLIPDNYEDDFRFLQSTLNTTFASFIRVQFFLGLIMGVITFLTLFILHIDFAISTSITSAILAMIPIVGPILFLIPPAIAGAIASPQQLLILIAILVLSSQLVYNVWAPRLIGKALNIHPIIVLVSFLIGYKIAGVWGAIFAVPITSALAIIAKDVIKYWKEEADK